MVTGKQKPVVDTQKIMRKKPKYTTKESHQTTGEEINKGSKQRNPKTARKLISKRQ